MPPRHLLLTEPLLFQPLDIRHLMVKGTLLGIRTLLDTTWAAMDLFLLVERFQILSAFKVLMVDVVHPGLHEKDGQRGIS
mmetsp:Transcript_74848/g.200677  ORF Transcript_74848/g.200677 Transcript_74848/m.200677 type:complete len:80 (-) Transcript_74848:525-764(-)